MVINDHHHADEESSRTRRDCRPRLLPASRRDPAPMERDPRRPPNEAFSPTDQPTAARTFHRRRSREKCAMRSTSDDVLRSPGATIDEKAPPRRSRSLGGAAGRAVTGSRASRASPRSVCPPPAPPRAARALPLVSSSARPRSRASCRRDGDAARRDQARARLPRRERGRVQLPVPRRHRVLPDALPRGPHVRFTRRLQGPRAHLLHPPTAALLTAVTGVRPSLVRAVAVGGDAAQSSPTAARRS